MYQTLGLWLQNINYLRYVTIISLLLSVVSNVLDSSSLATGSLYTLTVVLAGISFWNRRIEVVVAISLLILAVQLTINWTLMEDVKTTFFHILLTAAIGIIAKELMKGYINNKLGSIDLILALSNSLDKRDHYTSSHSSNVARYALKIAQAMNLPAGLRESIYIGGLLHDIGKIGISESVLLKPSKLTESEFDVIKQHPVIGYEIIKHIPQFKKNGVLDMVLYHHERYNGTGYPKGLKELQIPLAARIMAVADSFDAMTSKRVYRENRLELQDVIEELRRCRGTQFDPVVADVFLGILEEERENILIHDLDASIKRPHYI